MTEKVKIYAWGYPAADKKGVVGEPKLFFAEVDSLRYQQSIELKTNIPVQLPDGYFDSPEAAGATTPRYAETSELVALNEPVVAKEG